MSRPTQREVWDYLRKEGPKSYDELHAHFDGDENDISETVQHLKVSGHVSFTLARKVRANETDSLNPLCEPFGAGAGETVSGDPPPRKP